MYSRTGNTSHVFGKEGDVCVCVCVLRGCQRNLSYMPLSFIGKKEILSWFVVK